MIYFDTDVLVHYFILQEPHKQALAQTNINKATANRQAAISILSLQEFAFALAKLRISSQDILRMLTELKSLTVFEPNLVDFQRAEALAANVSFLTISDCLHTALAERHCSELQTFNVSDFKRIQNHTSLKISIL